MESFGKQTSLGANSQFELRDPQFKDPQFTKLPLLLDTIVTIASPKD